MPTAKSGNHAPLPGDPQRFARSRQMIDALRREWIYSEKRPRDVVFLAVERLVREQPPMMVSQLTREAAPLAREIATQSGVVFDNWEACTRAVVRTLLMAETLHAPGGEVIRFDITSQASLVGSLRLDFCDAAEAFLVASIIRSLGDVTTRDHTALTHVLFRQFDQRVPIDQLEDRLAILMARLADRVALDGDVYIVQSGQPA